jgi:hypothetical protein
MRVRAKVLHPASLTYRELHHRAGKHGYQINRLIRDAAASVPPLYPVFCFYNPGTALRATAAAARADPTLGSALAGITVADAVRVKQLAFNRRPRTKRLTKIAPLVLGWDISCARLSRGFPLPVPRRREVLAGRRTPEINRRAHPRPVPPTQAPPNYLRLAISMLHGERTSDTIAASPRDPGLAGAVVVRTVTSPA